MKLRFLVSKNKTLVIKKTPSWMNTYTFDLFADMCSHLPTVKSSMKLTVSITCRCVPRLRNNFPALLFRQNVPRGTWGALAQPLVQKLFETLRYVPTKFFPGRIPVSVIKKSNRYRYDRSPSCHQNY